MDSTKLLCGISVSLSDYFFAMYFTCFDYRITLDIHIVQQYHCHDIYIDKIKGRRRNDSSDASGFRLIDALKHVCDQVDGLYESGCSLDTIHRLMQPPRQNNIASHNYHGIVKARVANKRNNSRQISEGTHWGRSQQKILKEWHKSNGQLNWTGDDMNIIQVGRPAVSRYHQQRRFYMADEGPDHEVHDFPTSELGIKLGGFMALSQYPTQ